MTQLTSMPSHFLFSSKGKVIHYCMLFLKTLAVTGQLQLRKAGSSKRWLHIEPKVNMRGCLTITIFE